MLQSARFDRIVKKELQVFLSRNTMVAITMVIIPNREVKPISADGTAKPSGRVGSRQFVKSVVDRVLSTALFCFIRHFLRPSFIYLLLA